MKLIALQPSNFYIPTQLAARSSGLRIELKMPSAEDIADGGIISNFKDWLIEPDLEHYVTIKQPNGRHTYNVVTGRQCIESYLQELKSSIIKQGLPITADTQICLSVPAYSDPKHRRTYQSALQKAAKSAGLNRVKIVNEPDAVFEYFRLFRRGLDEADINNLSVMVIDFGGGTCNVSVVSTTRAGQRFQRPALAGASTEAPRAGGLYIDREILARGMSLANLSHLWTVEPKTPLANAFEAWRLKHLHEAEALKRYVSDTGKSHVAHINIDGELATLLKRHDSLSIPLTRHQLREIVKNHWERKGIKTAVELSLKRLRDQLAISAQRKDVAADPRALISHVILAGGSSRLAGFEDLIHEYFQPYSPPLLRIGKDYPFSVSVGMALEECLNADGLVLNKASAANAGPPTTQSDLSIEKIGFLPTFADTICLYYRANPDSDFDCAVLFDKSKSTWELLQAPSIELSIKIPSVGQAGYRKKLEFQIADESDPEARLELSPSRLNVSERFLSIPARIGKELTLRVQLQHTGARLFEIALQIVNPDNPDVPLAPVKVPAFLTQPKSQITPSRRNLVAGAFNEAADIKISESHVRQTITLQTLCIDIGTATTTCVSLFDDTPLSRATLEQLASTKQGPPVRIELLPEAGVATTAARPTDPTASSPSTPAAAAKAPAPVPTQLPAEAETRLPPKTPDLLAQAPSGQSQRIPIPSPESRPAKRRPTVVAPPLPLPAHPFAGSEKDFVDHLTSYCEKAGYLYTPELIETVYLSLKVRPLVVLAGPSGVGKSALGRLIAEGFGLSHERLDTLRMAVEAHWTDGRFLFGRRDQTGRYRATPFHELLRRAEKYPDRLYHVIIDEMNLAHVEYYFAHMLSAMESDGIIEVPDHKKLCLPMADNGIPLVRFCGTINVDETTQILSDKVIDRSNIIELDASPPPHEINNSLRPQSQKQDIYVPLELMKKWRVSTKQLTVPQEVRDIWDILAGTKNEQPLGTASLAFGHRIVRDISQYVAYSQQLGRLLTREDAIDIQIKQRLLPKIRGDVRIRRTLDALSQYLDQKGFRRSQRRLHRMRSQLDMEHFVTFWS